MEQSLLARGSDIEEIDDRRNKRREYLGTIFSEHISSPIGANVILNVNSLTTADDIRAQFEALCKKNDIDIGSRSKLL